MHFSIAPTEITSHMRQQFEVPAYTPRKRTRSIMRRRMSAALHGLADRLDSPSTR